MEVSEHRRYSTGYRNCWRYYDKEGLLHRDGDRPAIVCHDGSKYWYQHGKQHRDGDKPAVIYTLRDGNTIYPNIKSTWIWMQNGQKHRDINIGPALETLYGCKQWFVHNKIIKEEGCERGI